MSSKNYPWSRHLEIRMSKISKNMIRRCLYFFNGHMWGGRPTVDCPRILERKGLVCVLVRYRRRLIASSLINILPKGGASNRLTPFRGLINRCCSFGGGQLGRRMNWWFFQTEENWKLRTWQKLLVLPNYVEKKQLNQPTNPPVYSFFPL